MLLAVGLWITGLPFPMALMFTFGAMVLYLTLTRVVAEGGIPAMRPGILTASFLTSGAGTTALGPRGLVALGLTYGWHAELRTLVMAALANGLKLTGLIEGSRRRLAWALMLAITLSIIASTLVTLASAYEHGGVNIIGPGAGMVAARDLTRFITMNRFGPQLDAWLFMGLGGGAMSLLMWARHRFLWWPLSPEGFVIGPNWKTSHIFFSAFVACS